MAAPAVGDNDADISIEKKHPVDVDLETCEEIPDLPPDPDAHLTPEERAQIDRKLVWKLDLILIPWLMLTYLLTFLDRVNIGNAKIAGLQKDLQNMSSSKYNLCLTVYFISYALFQPLSNVMLKRFRSSKWMPTIVFLTAIIMISMGFVKNWSDLMAARWFLGMVEGGIFPGIAYILSCWYKRSEYGARTAIFFSGAAVAGSFGGLLAAAIENMGGLGDRPGWAWIFIMEGILTALLAFLSFWLVKDFPSEATFLSESNRARVIRRLKLDKQSSAGKEAYNSKYVWQALRDYKMWLGMVIFAGCDMPLYGFSLFLPSIIAELGFANTTAKAQLLTVPPYAVGAMLTIAVGVYADRTRKRGICNIVVGFIGIAGYAMLLGSQTAGVKYTGCFLAALGIYPTVANTIAWTANNTEGVYKRGIVIGAVIGFGGLNGVVSSNIYFNPPKYTVGHSVILAYLIVGLLGGSLLLEWLLIRENKLRKEGKRDHWVQGLSKEEIEMLGDWRPDFIYTL